jgi:hypothetical protein
MGCRDDQYPANGRLRTGIHHPGASNGRSGVEYDYGPIKYCTNRERYELITLTPI